MDGVFSDGDDIEYGDINNKLTYLEQCVKETLRVYSVAEVTLRVVQAGVFVADLILPRGKVRYLQPEIPDIAINAP